MSVLVQADGDDAHQSQIIVTVSCLFSQMDSRPDGYYDLRSDGQRHRYQNVGLVGTC